MHTAHTDSRFTSKIVLTTLVLKTLIKNQPALVNIEQRAACLLLCASEDHWFRKLFQHVLTVFISEGFKCKLKSEYLCSLPRQETATRAVTLKCMSLYSSSITAFLTG